uniref:2-polyprenyl-6-methoxyphenol hydroxylase n=1 Tax=Candidatus Kentrum sp. DK TaxID=2126562 RepID=A0A450SL47_9GAMM|nr:MAG: 2-polyprenyl-6-methoxyphenol hydroxylase [Candidatus Kentron sp. DK]
MRQNLHRAVNSKRDNRFNDMIESTKTPVLIAGGGPVGLVLAIDLARRGVRSILVNREPDTPTHPRGNSNGFRTMEHYRRLGFADAIRRLGPPADHPRDVVYLTRLTGHEIAREPHPSPDLERKLCRQPDSLTPEPTHRANQIQVEAFLKRHAERLEHCDIRFGWTLTGFRAVQDRVDVDIRDGATGKAERIQCDYLIGCDGAQSTVRRGLGIAYGGWDTPELPFMSGRMLSAHVRIPGLREAMPGKPAWQHWVLNAEARAVVFALDGRDDYLILFKPRQGETPEETAETADAAGFIDTLAGRRMESEILSVKSWTAGFALVAERFRQGRVFLAGDSAHLFTPTGGLGMNTGIEDATNLAWKLAAAEQGWGGPGLLDSYEAERRPIAIRNTGIARGYSQSLGTMPIPEGIEADGEKGERQRAAFAAQLMDTQAGQSMLLGTQLGARYDGSPLIIGDGTTPPPDDPVRYTPSACPGGRAPHLWFRNGSTLLDHLGPGFTLLVDEARGADPRPLMAAASHREIPLHVLWLAETQVDLSRLRELYQKSLVLIRPDQHVAWRGDAAPEDAEGLLRQAAGWLP